MGSLEDGVPETAAHAGGADEEGTLDAIAFVGDTLGPLFYYDPAAVEVRPTYEALSGLDVKGAAAEWPFVSTEDAERALRLMVDGLTRDAGGEVPRGSATDGGARTDSTDEGARKAAGNGALQAVPDDLAWEYRRLFVGPAAKAAPPWGSVYTDRECVIFGASTLELRRWMRQVGIEKLNDDNEPEDHIGLMLTMLSWVATRRPDVLDEFLGAHLLTWAPHFLEGVERETTHPFFEGLARLARASLAGIRRERGIEVELPRFYR